MNLAAGFAAARAGIHFDRLAVVELRLGQPELSAVAHFDQFIV